MKKILLSIFASLIISLAFGQDINVTYKVTNYSINGANYDDLALNGDVSLSFYNCDENTLCFTNHWRTTNSQSYGAVYAFKERKVAETSTTYGGVEFKFTWQFFNTYDSKRGQAAVTITNIIIGNTVKFTAEIVVLDTNEILVFKGYLE